jgi:hypothetical protein
MEFDTIIAAAKITEDFNTLTKLVKTWNYKFGILRGFVQLPELMIPKIEPSDSDSVKEQKFNLAYANLKAQVDVFIDAVQKAQEGEDVAPINYLII